MIHPNGVPPQPSMREIETQAPAESDVCPDCQGTGFFARDVPVEHPDFGQAFPCHCMMADRLRQRIAKMGEFSQLDLLPDKTFATFLQEPPGYDEPSRTSLRQAFALCRDFAADAGKWLFLHGPHGCGKTHLAAAVAHQMQEQGTPVLLLPVPDLLDHLRATFAPGSPIGYDELFHLVREVPVLILDDMGAEKSTEFARDKMFQLLNHRHLTQRPTVITSNQMVFAFEDRIRSRLADARIVTRVTIDAPDFRGYNSPHPLTDLNLQLNMLGLHQEQQFGSFDHRRSADTNRQISTLKHKVDTIREFAREPEGWLVLNGPRGCGKTHLAAAVANEWAAAGRTVLFVPFAELKDFLRSTLSRNADALPRVTEQLRKVSHLVLDDYQGADTREETWASEKVRQILEHRFYARQPTVITLCTPKDHMDDWLESRVFELSRATHLQVKDFPRRSRSTSGGKKYQTRT